MTNEFDEVRTPVRDAASEGGDLRERVRGLVLQAIMNRKADAKAFGGVMKSALEGLGEGYGSHAGNAGESLKTAVAGVDEAVGKSLYALRTALEESWSQGRRFADTDLREAYDAVRGLEDNLLGTLKETGSKSQGLLKEEFGRIGEHLSRNGSDTGKQISEVLGALSRDLGQVAGDAARDAKVDAREAAGRLSAVTAGILHGLADALHSHQKS
jgi:hypothetical protein